MFSFLLSGSKPPNLNAYNIALLQVKLDDFFAVMSRFDGQYKSAIHEIFPPVSHIARYQSKEDQYKDIRAALDDISVFKDEDSSLKDISDSTQISESLSKAYKLVFNHYNEVKSDLVETNHYAFSVIFHCIHMIPYEYRYRILLKHLRQYCDFWPHAIARQMDQCEIDSISFRDSFNEVHANLTQSMIFRTSKVLSDSRASYEDCCLYKVLSNNNFNDSSEIHQSESTPGLFGIFTTKSSELALKRNIYSAVKQDLERTKNSSAGFNKLFEKDSVSTQTDILSELGLGCDLNKDIEALIEMCRNIVGCTHDNPSFKHAENSVEKFNRIKKVARDVLLATGYRNLSFFAMVVCFIAFSSIYFEGFKHAVPHISLGFMIVSVSLQIFIWYAQYNETKLNNDIFNLNASISPDGSNNDQKEIAALYLTLKDIPPVEEESQKVAYGSSANQSYQ